MLDMSKIVSNYTELKDIGNQYTGVCPFCNKENLVVSKTKEFFHCFDCKASGDAISFMEKISKTDQTSEEIEDGELISGAIRCLRDNGYNVRASITHKEWNTDQAIKDGKAMTRDGHLVCNLRIAEVEGEVSLLGDVTIRKIGDYRLTQTMVWDKHGMGVGPNDLVFWDKDMYENLQIEDGFYDHS